MDTTTFSNGRAVAQAHFDTIVSKGKKFKDRQVPIYIREKLWIPFYLTIGEEFGEHYIHIIQLPNEIESKVHFKAHLIIKDEST